MGAKSLYSAERILKFHGVKLLGGPQIRLNWTGLNRQYITQVENAGMEAKSLYFTENRLKSHGEKLLIKTSQILQGVPRLDRTEQIVYKPSRKWAICWNGGKKHLFCRKKNNNSWEPVNPLNLLE